MAARDAMAVDTTGDTTGAPAGGPRCFAVRYRRWILLATAIVVPIVAILGANVARYLSVGGFVASSSDYEVGRRILTDELHGGTPNFVVLVTVNGAAARTSAVDSDDVQAAGVALTNELAAATGCAPSLLVLDGRPALPVAQRRRDRSPRARAHRR